MNIIKFLIFLSRQTSFFQVYHPQLGVDRAFDDRTKRGRFDGFGGVQCWSNGQQSDPTKQNHVKRWCMGRFSWQNWWEPYQLRYLWMVTLVATLHYVEGPRTHVCFSLKRRESFFFNKKRKRKRIFNLYGSYTKYKICTECFIIIYSSLPNEVCPFWLGPLVPFLNSPGPFHEEDLSNRVSRRFSAWPCPWRKYPWFEWSRFFLLLKLR